MMIEEVGNPKGLKSLTPGNLEWSNPEVPDERDDEPRKVPVEETKGHTKLKQTRIPKAELESKE